MKTDRLTRLLKLITLLEGGREPTQAQILRELGISRRTFFRDLTTLQEAGVPVFFDRGKGYRIARHFYLPPLDLTVPEALSLLVLGKSASNTPKRPLSSGTLSAVNKLVASLPEPIREACTDLTRHISVRHAPQVEHAVEDRWFSLLQRCIDERRACTMTYRGPRDAEAFSCELCPYALHFGARAWYVLGQTDRFTEVRMFKLARVQSLTLGKGRFERPEGFTVQSVLGNAWQLIPSGKVERVELRFSPRVAMNVTEVRWHASQRQVFQADGSVTLSFEVAGLEEIAWWVCGYADQVKVVKPAALRKRVRQMHTAAAELNGDG